MTASGHAFAAVGAGGSRRTLATEVWVINCGALGKFLFRTEENAERSQAICFAEAHAVCNLLDGSVAVALKRIRLDTEHALCLVVIGAEQSLPVGHLRPRTGFEKC